MKKRFFVNGLAVICSSLIANASLASDLNIWNWSDFIADDTLANFEKETKLKTNYAVFDNNELVEARLLSGHSGFDAVMSPSYYIPRLAKAQALEKIDKSKLPNYINLDKKRMELMATVDPNNDYAIPYAENTLGIGYNKEKIEEIFGKGFELNSWEFLLKKENSDKLRKCGIAVLDSPMEVISALMHIRGLNPRSENREDYQKVKEDLTALATNVAYFHSSRYINDLASGDICVAVGYSGDILQSTQRAIAAGKKYSIEYRYPKEGSLLWFDSWAIAKGAKNYDNAHIWLNYLQRPDVVTPIINQIRYIIPVAKSIEEMDPKLKQDPSVNLSEEDFKKAFFPTPPSAKVSRITNNIWNYMKLNSEQNSDDASIWK